MSELTDTVRKMLSQAQVFARDTPFEAVSRARQAIAEVDAALAELGNGDVEQRASSLALRKLAAGRAAKYEARLEEWLAAAEERSRRYTANEQERLAQPMRTKV